MLASRWAPIRARCHAAKGVGQRGHRRFRRRRRRGATRPSGLRSSTVSEPVNAFGETCSRWRECPRHGPPGREGELSKSAQQQSTHTHAPLPPSPATHRVFHVTLARSDPTLPHQNDARHRGGHPGSRDWGAVGPVRIRMAVVASQGPTPARRATLASRYRHSPQIQAEIGLEGVGEGHAPRHTAPFLDIVLVQSTLVSAQVNSQGKRAEPRPTTPHTCIMRTGGVWRGRAWLGGAIHAESSERRITRGTPDYFRC